VHIAKVILTDAAVQRYKAAPGERKNYFDKTLPGFALRVSGPPKAKPGEPQVTTGGSKSWVLYYRYGGKLKMLTLQPGYPALGLKDARHQAKDALQAVGRQEDPAALKAAAAQRARDQAKDTVEAVIDEFIQRALNGRRSPHYIRETRRNFDLHVIPAWKGRPIASIRRRNVIELLNGIADGGGSGAEDKKDRRKGARGGPIAANRVQAALSRLFNWAINEDYAGLDASPVYRVEKRGEERRRDRVLSDAEIRQVWRAADELGYPWAPFFQLALTLARRREEIAAMRRDELDLDSGVWTIPGSRTKSGRPVIVPLPPLAVRLLRAALANGPKDALHVMTTRRRRGNIAAGDAPISGYSKAQQAIAAKIAALAKADHLPPLAHWTPHDLRRTAATALGKLGTSRLVIKRVLDHADHDVTAIYDRYEYLDEKRRALDAWGQFLENLTSPTPGANVVPLRREA